MTQAILFPVTSLRPLSSGVFIGCSEALQPYRDIQRAVNVCIPVVIRMGTPVFIVIGVALFG